MPGDALASVGGANPKPLKPKPNRHLRDIGNRGLSGFLGVHQNDVSAFLDRLSATGARANPKP